MNSWTFSVVGTSSITDTPTLQAALEQALIAMGYAIVADGVTAGGSAVNSAMLGVDPIGSLFDNLLGTGGSSFTVAPYAGSITLSTTNASAQAQADLTTALGSAAGSAPSSVTLSTSITGGLSNALNSIGTGVTNAVNSITGAAGTIAGTTGTAVSAAEWVAVAGFAFVIFMLARGKTKLSNFGL
jgi:hypothetical protein